MQRDLTGIYLLTDNQFVISSILTNVFLNIFLHYVPPFLPPQTKTLGMQKKQTWKCQFISADVMLHGRENFLLSIFKYIVCYIIFMSLISLTRKTQNVLPPLTLGTEAQCSLQLTYVYKINCKSNLRLSRNSKYVCWNLCTKFL